jgi:hypothetical protein
MPELIDLPAFATAFGRAMHDAGIPVTPERSMRFARALDLAPPATRRQLYWTARAVFLSGHEQVAKLDRVFAAIFEGIADPVQTRGDQNAPPLQDADVIRRPARPWSVPLDSALSGTAPPRSELREPGPGTPGKRANVSWPWLRRAPRNDSPSGTSPSSSPMSCARCRG